MDAEKVHYLITDWMNTRHHEVQAAIATQEIAIGEGRLGPYTGDPHLDNLYRRVHTYGVKKGPGGGLLPFDVRMHFTKILADMLVPHLHMVADDLRHATVCLMQMIEVYSVTRDPSTLATAGTPYERIDVKFAMPWLGYHNGVFDFGRAEFAVNMSAMTEQDLSSMLQTAMRDDATHYLIDQLYFPARNQSSSNGSFLHWVPAWLAPYRPKPSGLRDRLLDNALPGDTAVVEFVRRTPPDSYMMVVELTSGDTIAELYPWSDRYNGLMSGHAQANKPVTDTLYIAKDSTNE